MANRFFVPQSPTWKGDIEIVGVCLSVPHLRFPLSNSRTLRDINFKFGLWVRLGDRMAGIKLGHQRAPYGALGGTCLSMFAGGGHINPSMIILLKMFVIDSDPMLLHWLCC